MSSVIGEAFVRVRPETSGFEHEAEPGIKSAFSHLAKIAAAAFAVEQSFQFGREIISGAADVQKQIEGVRETFSGFSDALLSFNDKLAGSFGVSSRVADTASATLGRTFENLGIGRKAAEEMTKGLEQLGGSLATIKNIDPRTLFQALPQLLAGNTRIFRQFGLVIDQSTLKIAAFKLGITDSITQALTPAQRAIAAYAVATGRLPELIDQARKHSHDFADELAVFHATISNLRDDLGARLLPAASVFIAFLSRAIPAAVRAAGVAFDDLKKDISEISAFVRPAFEPLISEIERVRHAFADGGIGGAIRQIKKDLVDLRPAAVVAAAAIAAIGLAFTSAFVAEAPLTAFVLAVAGIGIAIQEGMKRSEAFRNFMKQIGDTISTDVLPKVEAIAKAIRGDLASAFDFIGRHATVFEAIAGAIAGAAAAFKIASIAIDAYKAAVKAAAAAQLIWDAALIANPIGLIVVAIGALIGALAVLYFKSATVRRILNGAFDGLKEGARAVLPILRDIANDAVQVGHTVAEGLGAGIKIVEGLWQRFGGNILAIIRGDFEAVVGIVRGALKVIQGIIDVITGLITGDWGKAWKGIKEIVTGSFDAIKAAAKGFANELHQIFDIMWRGIAELFLRGVEKIVSLLAAIPSVHANIPFVGRVGFTNPFKGADVSLKAAIDGLAHNSKHAADLVGDTAKKAASLAGQNAADGLKQASDNIRSASDQAKHTLAADSAAKAADIGNAANAAGDAIDTAIAGLNTRLNRTISVNDAQIGKLKTKISDLGTQIADALKQETTDVANSIQQAEQNLNSIGSTLAQTIGQVIDKPLTDIQNRLSRQGNKDALEQLRQSILLPGGKQLSTDPEKALAQLQALAARAGNVNRLAIEDFVRQYQGAVLSVKQDQANVVKEGATRRIADLTDALNSGKIKPGEFKKAILAELTRDHVSYRNAGSLLGTAFANGFKAQVKGLFDQAAAIAATPADRRAGVNAFAPSIIRPIETLQKAEAGIAKLTHQKMDAQTALQKRIATAAEQQAQILAKIASTRVNPNTPTGKNPAGQQKTSTTYNKTTG